MVCKELQTIIGDAHLDPDLDAAACLIALLGTAADLIERWRRWELYPFLAFLMVKEFNPHHSLAGYAFLKVAEE